MTLRGASMFAAYAFPPNELGYCGPASVDWIDLMGDDDQRPLRLAISGFDGAWPYLEMIGGLSGLDPLDPRVVEAYWIGNRLLEGVDLLTWGNSVDGRFSERLGASTGLTDQVADGRPNHAFHVFCVYPWVGLLRGGAFETALTVLDRCRVRWGTVQAVFGGTAAVRSRALGWDGRSLSLGAEAVEVVRVPSSVDLEPNAVVSMHWDWACESLTPEQATLLETETRRHLAIANRTPMTIEARLAK